MMTSLSALSAIPTEAVIPRPSARALAYGTTEPVPMAASRPIMRKVRIAPLSPCRYAQASRPLKMATSVIRSRVESKKAPHFDDVFVKRAICPSMLSKRASPPRLSEPTTRRFVGSRVSDSATPRTVPVRVTASALTPILTKSFAMGPKTV